MQNKKPIHYHCIRFMNVCNVPRMVCDHIVSKEHSHRHRKVADIVLMMFGVLVSKTFFLKVEIQFVTTIADCSGYFIHAIGGIPFIEPLVKKLE